MWDRVLTYSALILTLVGGVSFQDAFAGAPSYTLGPVYTRSYISIAEDGTLTRIFSDINPAKIGQRRTTGNFSMVNGSLVEDTVRLYATKPADTYFGQGGYQVCWHNSAGRTLLTLHQNPEHPEHWRQHGLWWDGNQSKFLPNVTARDMNEAGVGVGSRSVQMENGNIDDQFLVPVIISATGQVQDLPCPYPGGWRFSKNNDSIIPSYEGRQGKAIAINSTGTILVIATTSSYFNQGTSTHLYKNGAYLPQFVEGEGVDLNDLEQVVGWRFYTSLNSPPAGTWLWTPGSPMRNLGEGRLEKPLKINNDGDIIYAGRTFIESVRQWPKIWRKGTFYDIKSRVSSLGDYQLDYITHVNDRGMILTFGTVNGRLSSAVLGGSSVSLEFDPGVELKAGQEFAVTVEVKHQFTTPATYKFSGPLLSADLPDSVEMREMENPGEFILSADDPVMRFVVPCKALQRGYVVFNTAVEITDSAGIVTINTAEEEILVEPLKVELTVTKDKHLLNQTPESQWGTRSRVINDALRANNLTPFSNLIEIEMKIRNEGTEEITNLNIPGVRDVLGYIQSTVIDSPGVPLTPIRLYAPGGAEVDLTFPQDPTVIQDVTLQPGEEAVFAWVLDAFDGNPDPAVDDSVELEFTPLILGALRGKNVQMRGEKAFSIIDRPLLEWGVRPKDGRVDYPSGSVARVEGYIENISTRNDRPPQDIRVMLFQIPEGNLGGGFMFEFDPEDPEEAGGETQKAYAVFDLPAEGPGKIKNLEAVFRSFPTDKDCQGKVKFIVKLSTVSEDPENEEEQIVDNANQQAILKDGWKEEFTVNFAANRAEMTREEQCEALAGLTWEWVGVSPFLCGAVNGISIDFTDGIIGLGEFLFNSGELLLDAGTGIAAWELNTMKRMVEAVRGDPVAQQALYQEIYVQYRTYVEMQMMAGEAGTKTPMLFDAFVEKAGSAMYNFWDVGLSGDLDKIKYNVGHFLGANPDLVLEPLVVSAAYMRIRKALINLQGDLVDSYIRTAIKVDEDRLATSIGDRIKKAVANGRSPESGLLPGDLLTDSHLHTIYGVTRKQKEAIQKIARDNKVNITFRSRNPVSIDLLKKGKAYPKPQSLKEKCVNRIDIEYLGYRRDAFGKLEVVEPRPGLLDTNGKALTGDNLEAALDVEMAKIEGQFTGKPLLKEEVRKRMKTRAEEWNKCFTDHVDPSQAGVLEREVPVAFEAELQFTPAQRDNIQKVGADEMRKVTYTPIPGSNPRAWELKMGGPKGGPPKQVTGDVDFMSILDESGGFIRDEQKLIEVYKQLATMLDMQHGESFSFFLQKARVEHLRGNTFGEPDAGALVAISGFGDQTPRAAYFKDNLSVIDNPNCPNAKFLPRRKKTPQSLQDFILRRGQQKEVRRVDPSGEFMLLDGMYVNTRPPLDLVSRFIPVTLGERLEAFFLSKEFLVPALLLRMFDAEGRAVFTRQVEGKIMQAIRDGSGYLLKVWTEDDGWQNYSITTPRNSSSGPPPLQFSPMSVLPEGASAGDTIVAIAEQADLKTPGDFFRPGDRVVINPGGTNQEIRVVQALGSLILTEPLEFDHDEGEMVAMLPPLGPTVSLVGLVQGGEVNGRTGIELRVKAGSTTSTITRVEFYIGGALIGESTGPNFRLPWLPLANGDHQIKAVAHDDNGQQAESETITVKVNHIGTFDGPIKGSYSGLLRDEPATQPFCGTATMTTTAVGGYSLQVVMGGRSYRVKGVFDAEGTALAELKRPRPQTPLRVRLTASTAPLVDQVLGVITDGEFNGPAITGDSFATTFTLDRLVWHPRSNPAPQAGPYTVVMPADDFALALGAPLGDGTATLSVTTAGRARMACKLADGTGATVSCLLSKDGRLPLFAALYKKKGMLSGWFQFQSLPNISDGAARIDWVRPSDPKAKLFKTGFETQVNALASRYDVPPANVRMIPLVNVGGNLTATFEGGDLTIPLERLATMDGGSRVVVPMQGAEGLTIKSVSKTGMVSGNFWHPETGAKTAFTGMMFQKQDMIAGSFLAGPQGGGFTFEANPSWEVTGADALPLGSRLPKLAIRSPRARQVLPAGLGEVSVSGTASHSSGITGVYWQMLKDGVLTEPAAATGTTNWSFPIPLAAGEGGLFTVFARANSVSGEQSNVVTSEFRVMKLADLEVLVTGPGSVSKGFLGTSSREVGRLYKLIASPQRGKRFLGWSGSLTSSSRTLSFLMQEGLVLHAYFGD